MVVRSLQDLAKEATTFVQDACNGSGLAHSLARVFSDLREHGIVGTDERNKHPIVRMYLFKMMDLAGCEVSTSDFRKAYEECKALENIVPLKKTS